MKKYAFISDIHCNAIALAAVLADISDVDKIISLGDTVSDGAQPHQVIELLQQHIDVCIMGNMDSLMLNPELPPATDTRRQKFHDIALWSAEQLTEHELDFIHSYQSRAQVNDILCYHGSPRHNEDVIIPTTSDEQLASYFTGYDDISIFIGGHTHQHMLCKWRDKQVIVAGSVGLAYRYWTPNEAPRAPYAEYTLITIDNDVHQIEFKRVPYDVDAYHQAIRDSGMPHADWLVGTW
jgi:putative phosphoesterase